MAMPSVEQRAAAVVTDTEEEAIVHQPEWSTEVDLENPEPFRTDIIRSWWGIILLLLEIRRRFRRMERRNGLPLPATTGNPQSSSWFYKAMRLIREISRGQRGKDVFSSIPLLCSATAHFVSTEQVFDTSASIDSSSLRLLRAISFCLWGLFYTIYHLAGTPSTMSDGQRNWFRGLIIINSLFIVILCQHIPLVLNGYLLIVTVSTAMALWIQKIWDSILDQLAHSATRRSSNNERTD